MPYNIKSFQKHLINLTLLFYAKMHQFTRLISVGIMGSEGRQAVRCSDFAFSQFRFLRRAILVHGRWYYLRVTLLVHYCFYKNVAFITPQLFYAFFSALSTQVRTSTEHTVLWFEKIMSKHSQLDREI